MPVVVFFLSVLAYILLVWSGGTLDLTEVGIAVVLGGVISLAARTWGPTSLSGKSGLSPIRWVRFVTYLFGPFMVGMIKANIDVATRVITGNIRPGIVKVQPGLKGDMAVTLLANSITLTPGTLTVDVDDESRAFYIHWIHVEDEKPSGEQVYGPFAKWARRIAE